MDVNNSFHTQDPSFTTPDFYEDVKAVSTLELFWWHPYILLCVYIVMLIGVPGNILTIIAYLKFDSLKTCTNMLIINQSLTDTLALLLAQPYLWAYYTEWGMDALSKNKYVCLLVLGIMRFSLVGSMANVMSLAVERLIAVFWALRYHALVTETRIKKAIKGLWAYMILVTIIPIFGINTWVSGTKCLGALATPAFYTTFVVLLPMALSLIVTAVVNIIIAVAAFRRSQITPPVIEAAPCAPVTCSQSEGFKITKMLLTVVGVYYLCWLPFFIVALVRVFFSQSWQGKVPAWFVFAHEISKLMSVVSTAANPFIYAWRDEGFQRAFMKLFRLNPSIQLNQLPGTTGKCKIKTSNAVSPQPGT